MISACCAFCFKRVKKHFDGGTFGLHSSWHTEQSSLQIAESSGMSSSSERSPVSVVWTQWEIVSKCENLKPKERRLAVVEALKSIDGER